MIDLDEVREQADATLDVVWVDRYGPGRCLGRLGLDGDR